MCGNDGADKGVRVHRHQYAVKSELGKADVAALYEQSMDKEFVYHVCNNCCLVETDSEPPNNLNPEALEIVLIISKMLNATPVDEVHVMRKTVVDGSNTSGFQRTMVVATNGWVNTSKGKVRIDTICLEEESAGIVRAENRKKEYRLDRLGIPLIEIMTAPDIKTPDHAVETAEKIGRMLRMTKVMRGIGSIRQDVNVSIPPHGARIEIKGFQNIRQMKQVIENELERQTNYSVVINELKKRFNGKIKYNFEIYYITSVFEGTKSRIFKQIKKGLKVYALKMPNFSGIFNKELLKSYRYGTELSIYAQPAGVKGIIHSDENLYKYKLEDEIIDQLNVMLDFPFVMVVAPEQVCINALKRVYERSLLDNVPAETRKVNDFVTYYLRPLPGAARMYPETDIVPVDITKLCGNIKVPEDYEARLARLIKVLGKDLAEKIVVHPYYDVYEQFSKKNPKTAAWVITELLKTLSRDKVNVSRALLVDILGAYTKGIVVRAAFEKILTFCVGNNTNVKTAVKTLKLERIKGAKLKKIVKELKDMRAIMRNYRLRVDPKDVQDMLKEKKK
jgi:glutamyl-tRNA(Gln) amidotransferase subunit E